MDKELYKNIKSLATAIKEIEEKEIRESSELVDNIIKYKCKDENIISSVFDKILSIAFAAKEDVEEIYYKLLNYTRGFNEELCNDYEEIFISQFEESIDEEDDTDIKHMLKKE